MVSLRSVRKMVSFLSIGRNLLYLIGDPPHVDVNE